MAKAARCTAVQPGAARRRCPRAAKAGSLCGRCAKQGCTVPSGGWSRAGRARAPYHYRPPQHVSLLL